MRRLVQAKFVRLVLWELERDEREPAPPILLCWKDTS
jgi:hypothetical protein